MRTIWLILSGYSQEGWFDEMKAAAPPSFHQKYSLITGQIGSDRVKSRLAATELTLESSGARPVPSPELVARNWVLWIFLEDRIG
jgi:hypothetical protein